jgi:hypothetical protein
MGKLLPSELSCAFSLVTKSRTLDLVAQDVSAREAWVKYFKTTMRSKEEQLALAKAAADEHDQAMAMQHVINPRITVSAAEPRPVYLANSRGF